MELVRAMESVRSDFNAKERVSPTIRPCFKKVGLDVFDAGSVAAAKEWIRSLNENALYKSLVTNQEALDLDPPAQTRAADEDELAADFERFLQTGEA